MAFFLISLQTIRPTVEDMSTLKSCSSGQTQLIFVLWLLACCTGAASEDYVRIMWVSTTGEDSPQCIHDTPTSDPVPHPRHLNESCGSLNYALTHIGNDTLIVIGCGIHVLEPVDSLLDGTPLMNLTYIAVFSACKNAIPQIQCTGKANLAFYNAEFVYLASLAFRDCGEQMQHSVPVTDSSTLYFQDCNTVRISHILINITGPYGRGISFIRYETSVTQKDVLMEISNVEIYHYGTHGSGIHFEVLAARTDASLAKESYQLNDISVYNPNVHPSYNITASFIGINITVMGDGEGARGEIMLSFIFVNRSTRGDGISVALHDTVGFKASLNAIGVLEECEKYELSNISSANISDTISNNNIELRDNSSIRIELRGNSTGNHIQVAKVRVGKCRAATGNAFSIEVTKHSEENVILLQNAVLSGEYPSEVHKRGLRVIISGWAKRNEIQLTGILSVCHTAYWGAGGYIEFSGHAMENSVTIRRGIFVHNHAFMGGGIAVVYRNFAAQNTLQMLGHELRINMSHNTAAVGGGVHLIIQDSSNKNKFDLSDMLIYSNTAHSGGGIFIHIRDSSVASRVQVFNSYVFFNSLLPSETHDMMGGGVHVEFSTVNATFRTDNIVNFTMCWFEFNTAEQGVGGGLSVLYKHSLYQGDSGDSISVDTLRLFYNMATIGSACAFQSLPTHEKRVFRDIRIADVDVRFINSKVWTKGDIKTMSRDDHISDLLNQSDARLQKYLSRTIIPSFQLESNTNLIFVKSVQLTTSKKLYAVCGASSQGIYALDSEIVIQAGTSAYITLCVATHGGAIALHGESYIRVSKESTLHFWSNHAFQRGGAIYASSACSVVPVSNCFLQIDQEWEESSGAAIFNFFVNTAKFEGQSVYISDIQNCFTGSTVKNITTNVVHYSEFHYIISFSVMSVKFEFTFVGRLGNGIYKQPYPLILTSKDYERIAVHREIMSGPNHASSVSDDLKKPATLHFIPGKQKKLTNTHAYDVFDNAISSLFSVLINKMDDAITVELDSFSKYTADFTVILHGIPQQHGMANHPHNRSEGLAVVRPPQLVLQSVDNTDLLLVMNIELDCCPPGYIFQYGSGDMGTCHCGMLTLIGIAECNESHPEVIGAVLKRDHWAGYLPSNDQHSCDGQKFFTGSCPPGYCQTQLITLPRNNSNQELQEEMCNGSNRKGLLCGDCLEGNSIAVNFNGIRPVCVSCEEGLSKVGILVWILSEWVPMFIFMFVLMLFNIDLVSGIFNSFLLFAQLLAFSTIRGDAELGPVHNAFVRIYRFLYGMWNLDFFGVLLPPYCLTPHAHLTLLQTILLHYSIGLFPLTVAITLIVLERSAEKWICCHRVDQCLRRMRRWKAKYSDGMSYDRALPAFVILGFTRFLVSSSYILVNQTITGEDEERKVVVWWQGSMPYGSIQHIAYFIPAIVILLVFVLLPAFVLLTLPIGPQLFGRLIIAVPPLRKLQRIQTFCSNVYTDRWVYHFVNVFQGCYKELFRSFSSLYLFHRIVHLLVAVFILRAEDALRIQIFLTVALLLLIATLQPYNSHKLNALDAAILGNLALILILSLHITDLNTPIGTRQFYASLQMILIYLPLLYPGILLGMKVYLKCRQLRCCQKQEEESEDNAEPLLEAPAERLGNLVLITELRAGVPTSDDDNTVTETETET